MKIFRIQLVLCVIAGSAAAGTASKPKPAKAAKAKPAAKPDPAIEPAPEPAKPKAVAVRDDSVEAPIAVVEPAKPKRERPSKRFYVRAGVAHVAPFAQSRELELANVDGAASLALKDGPIAGSGASVGSATIPALTVGYKLTQRWSLETVLGLPFTIKFKATGTLANESIAPTALGIPTGVPAIGSEMGEMKAAPPLVTATYQLRNHGAVRPYLGAGAAVMFAFDAHVTNPLLTEVGKPTMSVAPAPGLVLQTGAEAKLWKNIYARLDVKFIAFMMARARVEHIEVRTPDLPVFDTVEVGTAKMDVWVNPLIVQLGIGTDF